MAASMWFCGLRSGARRLLCSSEGNWPQFPFSGCSSSSSRCSIACSSDSLFARRKQLKQQQKRREASRNILRFLGCTTPKLPYSAPLNLYTLSRAGELPQRMHKLLFPGRTRHLLPNVAATFLVGCVVLFCMQHFKEVKYMGFAIL